MKTHTKSHTQNTPRISRQKQGRDASSPKSNVDTGEHISTDSSKEDPGKPKRLGESQIEINDETTI
ncbi:hypothetical protein ACFQ21_04855 [Ohtaekwangia kribbensis]|jgi:hypothetical protein|uniref:Uncharacterized protein n=1 Tax=Ohtaekwangia kribbensis TaxID=688913 RepID=A0ABW3JZP2_9BACT